MTGEIDRLQSEVDDLLALCREAGAVMESEPQDTAGKKRQRLGILLLKFQDGVLEPRYLRRLEQWLRADPQARVDYVDFQHLSAMLYDHFNPGRFAGFLDFLKDCIPARSS